MYGQKSMRLYSDEYYYKQYMEQLGRTLDTQKKEFLSREQETFVYYETLLADKQKEYEEKKISETEMSAVTRLVEQKLERRAAFERLMEHVSYAEKQGCPLVYETGYLELFGYGREGYRQDVEEALLLVIMLVLMLAPYCAGEYSQRMMNLIGTQYVGTRRILFEKAGAGILAASVVFAVVYLPQILYVGYVYGFDGLGESVDTISDLAGGFLHCPIGAYAAIVYVLRFGKACAAVLFILAVAVNRKNTIQAVSVLLFILAFPACLHLLGISAADDCSLNALFSVNMLLNQKEVWLAVMGGSIAAVLAAGSVSYLRIQ